MPKEKTFKTFDWDQTRLDALISAAGLSVEDAAEACGISVASMMNYRRGKANPSVDNLIKMADFFAVPTDYLLGRCDEETADAVLRDYSANFMLLRRASWEEYLRGRRPLPAQYIGRTYEAPWPYNLLDAIVRPSWYPGHREDDEDHYWKDIISMDQMNGLTEAMSSLAPREKEALLVYFREGLNLEEAGKHFGVTRERVRQIIAKAVRKLRHPSRSRLITLGVQGAALRNENKKRRLMLEAEAQELDACERALDLIRDGLWERAGALSRASGEFAAFQDKVLLGPAPSAAIEKELMYMSIDELELSVRSWNCCKRAGINTLGELVDRARLGEDGGLLRIRNLGRKSAEELIYKILVYTGKDYSELYGMELKRFA